MPRRDQARAKRSSREWAVRGGLAALVAVLGYFCVTFSMAQVVAATDPALAHRLAPYDGRITARLAASLVEGEASPADRARADELARLALRQDPTAVLAVSTLGINAETRGDGDTARRLFAYAFKLSRRDLVTQLWSIEDAVTRGDIAGAVRHYDIALRTRPDLAQLLFPVLASASSDPAIRVPLVRTLATKPNWGEGFINYISGNGPDVGATAQLFVDLRRAGVVVPLTAQASAVNALLAAGRFEEAWRYYTSIRPGSDRRRSRDPRFTAELEAPSHLDWTPVNESGVVTSAQDGAFDFTVPASVGGPLLQQVQLLPPGTYRIAGRSSGIEQEDSRRPYWTLQCRADGRELGRVVLPNSGQASGRFLGMFTVPAGCPVQTLLLMARPVDAVSGLAGRLEQVELVPAR
jgi:hypothetical protein